MNALIDTGSDINIICAGEYVKLGTPKLGKKTIRFCGIGGDYNETLGGFDTIVNIEEKDYQIHIHVVEELMKNKLILGADFLDTVEVTMKGGK